VNRKVFGIGLGRTGTTSLHHALTQLGFRCKHYPVVPQIFAGDFRCLDDCDAVCDNPVVPYYPQWDQCYPQSKFILTIRDVADWIKSNRDWYTRRGTPTEYMTKVRIAVFGIYTFDEDRFRHIYDTHVRGVKTYFENRPNDLLVMDICRGDGWEKLCAFLNIPTPDVPFPFART
jgi:hypothetical protein